MGGHRVPGDAIGDDGYDLEGYDENQRAEVLEAMQGRASEGPVVDALIPDRGEDIDPDEAEEVDIPDD